MKQALFDIEFNSDNIIEERQTGLKLTLSDQSCNSIWATRPTKRLKEIVTAPDWELAGLQGQAAKGGYRVSRHSQLFGHEIGTSFCLQMMPYERSSTPNCSSLDQYRGLPLTATWSTTSSTVMATSTWGTGQPSSFYIPYIDESDVYISVMGNPLAQLNTSSPLQLCNDHGSGPGAAVRIYRRPTRPI